MLIDPFSPLEVDVLLNLWVTICATLPIIALEITTSILFSTDFYECVFFFFYVQHKGNFSFLSLTHITCYTARFCLHSWRMARMKNSLPTQQLCISFRESHCHLLEMPGGKGHSLLLARINGQFCVNFLFNEFLSNWIWHKQQEKQKTNKKKKCKEYFSDIINLIKKGRWWLS